MTNKVLVTAFITLSFLIGGCSSETSSSSTSSQQPSQSVSSSSSITSIQGENFATADLLGKEDFITFFYTYGPPCLKTFPELQKIVNSCPQVKIVGIESTGKADSYALDVIKEMGLTFPLLSTVEGQKTGLFQLYQVRGLPTLLFVSKDKS